MISYLAWPVKMRGLDPDFHVTLKYFGEAEYDIEVLEKVLSESFTAFDDNFLTWYSEEFNHDASVLVFVGVDERLYQAHKALEYVRHDDFLSWRPHITLPTKIRDVASGVPPKDAIESIGPLTLYTKGFAGWNQRIFDESTRKFT